MPSFICQKSNFLGRGHFKLLSEKKRSMGRCPHHLKTGIAIFVEDPVFNSHCEVTRTHQW